jgi:Mrp family chromosome partitioning ATPase
MAGSTAREVVKRATDILTTNRANVLGVVLNNASNSLPYYYDYTHYHYDYRSSGEKGGKSAGGAHGDGGRGKRRSEKSRDKSGSNKGRLAR